MESLKYLSSVSDFDHPFTRKRHRSIAFIPSATNEAEVPLRAAYAQLNTSGQTFDETIARLYQPTFKADSGYSFTGKIKKHETYHVQSFLQLKEDKLIKVSVYTFEVDDRKDQIFEIGKQAVQNEVIYQELARHLNGAPFSVPEIFRFNYYVSNGNIHTVIEMQYIEPSRSPTKSELKVVHDFLKDHGIYHNDLIIDGTYLEVNTIGEEFYNTGNLIVDSDGKLWVIDFGSASNVKNKPRGGRRKTRKSRKRHKSKKASIGSFA